MKRAKILRVAVAAPVLGAFDYLPPPQVDPDSLIPGVRLRLPFGHGTRCGLLLETAATSDLPPSRLKTALQVLDTAPLLPPRDLELLLWAAEYYQHPVGEVVFSALPARLRTGGTPRQSGSRTWSLTASGREVSAVQKQRAPRQAAVLMDLEAAGGMLSEEALRPRHRPCAATLRTLEQKGWIEKTELPVAAPLEAAPGPAAPAPRLNEAQRLAVQAVLEAGEGFRSFLLDGVTGSGKTEVYLELAAKRLAAGRQVLVLVPEIGLTPQLLRRIQRRLAAPIAVLHSGLSDGERERAWLAGARGKARVLLGTRSAVLTPLPELGLIIVDEEHDLSFKQQEGFRYSARDLAVIRAQRTACPVVLGSATPCLETLRNAQAGRYRHVLLPERAGTARRPEIQVLDIRTIRLQTGVAPVLLDGVQRELEDGNQVLLFLNRRGYAPVLSCLSCNWISECPRCDARMSLHKSDGRLWCHHCGHNRPEPQQCPACGGAGLRPCGQGTERLEELLVRRFGPHGVARIDRDSTRRKGELAAKLNEIREGRHRLLLGTQMLAKGHHFPQVTLVGILDVDQGLYSTDYRAPERMAQLIVQVAGRAGRAEKPGRVVLQTRHPEHPLLRMLLLDGYGAFAEAALRERAEALLPPFSFQALLRADAAKESEPQTFLRAARRLATELGQPGVEIWGPVPAPMERRAGKTRAQILLQSQGREALHKLLQQWVPRLPALPESRRVRWSVDVDPQEMY